MPPASQFHELDQAIELSNQLFGLGNEFKDDIEIQPKLAQQLQQGRSVQFHAGEIHYAATDLLRGLRVSCDSNASLFKLPTDAREYKPS